MKISKVIIFTISLILIFSTQSFAENHSDDQQEKGDHMAGMNAQQDEGLFLEKKVIDGYTVSFHLMKVDPEKEHGGSYNFMVKIEDQGKALEDVVVNSKVIAPDGKSESKYLNKMGDWYMNGYSLGEKGKYQLIILFKTADGEKHNGGVYYESIQ